MISDNHGFSFIEVMMAIVILSISLVILMDSQSRSMNLVQRARMVDHAAALASSKMNEMSELATARGITSIEEEQEGEFDQERFPGFRWRTKTSKVAVPDFAKLMTGMGGLGGEEGDSDDANNAGLLAGPLKQIQDAWGESLRELRVEVIWKDGNQDRTYDLVTHLIAPDAIGQIRGMIGAMTGGRSSQDDQNNGQDQNQNQNQNQQGGNGSGT